MGLNGWLARIIHGTLGLTIAKKMAATQRNCNRTPARTEQNNKNQTHLMQNDC